MNIERIKLANTKYLGKNVIYYEELESTQKLAKKLLKENKIKNGTIIITDNQTSGIGTKGRTWYSNKGTNITMTLIVFPNCKIEKIEGITTKIAQCISDSLKELYDIDLKIKYPNDLLLNGKKICGILTESATENQILTHLLIGIGFNVNEENFNDETKEIATSLKKEYKREFIREEIIINIIKKLEKIINL